MIISEPKQANLFKKWPTSGLPFWLFNLIQLDWDVSESIYPLVSIEMHLLAGSKQFSRRLRRMVRLEPCFESSELDQEISVNPQNTL